MMAATKNVRIPSSCVGFTIGGCGGWLRWVSRGPSLDGSATGLMDYSREATIGVSVAVGKAADRVESNRGKNAFILELRSRYGWRICATEYGTRSGWNPCRRNLGLKSPCSAQVS
jgi:hypothetical protein